MIAVPNGGAARLMAENFEHKSKHRWAGGSPVLGYPRVIRSRSTRTTCQRPGAPMRKQYLEKYSQEPEHVTPIASLDSSR